MAVRSDFDFCILKGVLISGMVLVLGACATRSSISPDASLASAQVANYDNPNETLLKAASNYAGLINMYKEKLVKVTSPAEEDSYRYRIAEAYLQSGDPESALFYINPVVEQKRGSAELFLLKSQAMLALGESDKSLQAAVTAYGFDAENPQIFNQLGLIQASLYDIESARRNFEKARGLMIDDMTVQNNLAMLDMLEENYESACRRLMSLYRSGQADAKIKANLAMALAKNRQYKEFSSIFGAGKKEEDRFALYQILAGSRVIPGQTGTE